MIVKGCVDHYLTFSSEYLTCKTSGTGFYSDKHYFDSSYTDSQYTLTYVTLQLQYACRCGNNVTVWVHSSQRCNLALFLILSLTLLLSLTVYQGDHWSKKVLELRKTVFQARKVTENRKSHGKSWKISIMSWILWNFYNCTEKFCNVILLTVITVVFTRDSRNCYSAS